LNDEDRELHLRLLHSRYNTRISREKERAFLTQAYAFGQSCDAKGKWLAFKEAISQFKLQTQLRGLKVKGVSREGSIRPS